MLPLQPTNMVYIEQEANFFSVATQNQYSIQEFTQKNQLYFSEPVTANTIIPAGVYLNKVNRNVYLIPFSLPRQGTKSMSS